MTLPPGAERLFSHLPAETSDLGQHSAEVIERLFEDGDRRDLTWLTDELSEEELAAWVRQRGARRLSDRSRAFWSLVLDLPPESRAKTALKLWPL